MGYRTMCHHHKPIELIAERESDAVTDGEDEAEDVEAPTPLVPGGD